LEVFSRLAHNAADSIDVLKKLHKQANRPNIFIEIPSTKEGVFAIGETIYTAIPINVTLLFSRMQYVEAAQAERMFGRSRNGLLGLPKLMELSSP
jgi:transaldolase